MESSNPVTQLETSAARVPARPERRLMSRRRRQSVALLLLYTFGLDTAAFAGARPAPRQSVAAAAKPRTPAALPSAPARPQPVSAMLDPAASEAAAPAEPSPLEPPAAPASTIDLRAWSAEGVLANAGWTTAADGSSVTQTANAGPSFFVSPDEHQSVTLRARVRVDSSDPDDDFVGFVLGYRAPLSAQGHDPSTAEFVLLDWKKAAGTLGSHAAPEGFTLARVQGAVSDVGATYWAHDAAPTMQVLATQHAAGSGWAHDRDYALEIAYRASHVQLKVDGAVVLDTPGAFAQGRVGFYTYSQAAVRFSEVTLTAENTAPVANAGADRVVSAGASCTASVTLDGTASTDADGDALGYSWSGPFGTATGAQPSVSLPLGTHTITLQVDDGTGGSATDDVQLSVTDDTAPVITCPAAVSVSLTAEQRAASGFVLQPATATDNCALHRVERSDPAGGFVVGANEVTWTAVDEAGLATSCRQPVNVRSATAPSVAPELQKPELWPPNHKLVDVGLVAVASDPSGAAPAVSLQVWSDEPVNGGGDGNFSPDAQIDPARLWLRSERSGGGDGRVYLIRVTASNASAETASACATVVVPHSQSASARAAAFAQAAAARATCEATGGAPAGFHLLASGPYATSAPGRPVRPLLECVVESADGSLSGVFGYHNENAVPVAVPLGSENAFSPDPQDRGQPTLFQPGRSPAAHGAFVAREGSGTLHWQLRALSAAASSGSPHCASPPATPFAQDDTLDIDVDQSAVVAVLANDSDPQGDPLTLVRASTPAHGVAVANADGTVTYTPAAGFTGQDTFTYTISDSGFGTAQGSVRVNVSEAQPNQRPVANAGPDLSVTLPNAALLQGSASDDGLPAGSVLTVAWSVLGGPGPVTFGSAASAVTTAAFQVAGSYELLLTASDGELAASDSVSVVVKEPNQPPVVNAGPDQEITLPNSAALGGSATDDGLPEGSVLSVAWSMHSGPGSVTFANVNSAVTSASFDQAGTYVLRLTASDGALSDDDDVSVLVNPEPPPSLSIADASVVEGQGSVTQASLVVTLSRASSEPVTVQYFTAAATATSCDFAVRFGTLTFAPGVLQQTLDVPVFGDLAVEGDETLVVQLGNPLGAVLGIANGTLTIVDDDAPNTRPAAPSNLQPASGAQHVPADTQLRWTAAAEPDAGDSVRYDVQFGSALPTSGQAWSSACPSAAAPSGLVGAAFAHDEAADRLIVQTTAGETWVLADASGAGGTSVWTPLAAAGGPAPRRDAVAAYDPTLGRFILHGGCAGDCSSALSDTWVLTDVSASGGSPAWIALPDSPAARHGHAAFYDAGSGRLVVFGGSDAAVDYADLWVLVDANGVGAPQWQPLAVTGAAPASRREMAAAYDSVRNRLFVFGGTNAAGEAFADVWVLEQANGLGGTPVWSALAPSGAAPVARSGARAFYDDGASRLLLFGGTTAGLGDNTNFVFRDVWLLTGLDGAASAWVQTTPAGDVAPEGRFSGVAAFSQSENRLVVASGANNKLGASELDDLWVLRDAIGSLPLVSAGQEGTEHTPDLLAPGTYFWRVVAKDTHGAQAGSRLSRFDVGPPALSIEGAAGTEGDAGTTDFVFTLRLSRLSEADVSVSFETVAGSAAAGEDFVAASGSVVIPAGQTTATLAVAVNGDLEYEADETFSVTLSNALGAVLGTAAATGTILNDDPVPNGAPVVNAGPDQQLPGGANTAVLIGMVADDGLPASGSLSVLWSQVSGPAPAQFGDLASAITTATLPAPGTYVLRLSANDSELQASDDVSITLAVQNQPPAVEAGLPQTLALPSASTTLTGVVSDDGLPSGALVLEWSVVSGPAGVTFTDTAAATTDVSFAAAGPYVLRLTASDLALTTFDDVAVQVLPVQPPAELTVTAVDASGAASNPLTLAVTGSVSATITNLGGGTLSPFSVAFFEDRNGNGTFEPEDNLLGTGTLPMLLGGESATVAAEVSGTLLFSGNLIHVFADSERALAETDESNNYANSAPPCLAPPPPGPFAAQLEWSWTPNASANVMMTPVVADLNGDQVPDIVFSTGQLRAISGAGGAELFTVTNPAYPVYFASQIALGDIDGDGRVEIAAIKSGGAYLLVFEHDGTFKWESPLADGMLWGGPAIADIDGDGSPEIVVGRRVFNANGSVRWTGDVVPSSPEGAGPLSLVADLDMDGSPEVLVSGTAYRANGDRWWNNTTTAAALHAVGNFDLDPFPEVVAVHLGKVSLLEHDGGIKWGPITLPGGGFGGPPTVADFDGDGQPEIGVAGATRYVVFETNGSVLWSAVIQDLSSHITGSSVFDFDSDGQAEVVYADELKLRVYRGSDGTVLFETPNRSATGYENPVIADVDGDGSAEIVVAQNGASANGVRVFGSASGAWAGTRRIWNQHTYHITNVNDDGTIPAHEANSWETFNSYRQNTLLGCVYTRPDLNASYVRIATGANGKTLTARIGNQGNGLATVGIPVAFYDGDPSAGGRVLGTAGTSGLLAPGQFEDVAVTLPMTAVTSGSLWVVADDSGGLHGIVAELNELNNAFDSGLALLPSPGGADLAPLGVNTTGAAVDARTLALSGSVSAEVRNQGDAATSLFSVTVFEDRNANGAFDPGTDIALGVANESGLGAGERRIVSVSVAGSVQFVGSPVYVFVDSALEVPESDEANNVARSGAGCRVAPPPASFATTVKWSWTASATLPTSTNVMSAPAVVDLDGDSVADIVFATFAGGVSSVDGHLRAIRGGGGAELFTVTNPAWDISGQSNLAVGDIDNDGLPEIVAVHESGTRLIAFEHTGAFKWLSAVIESVGPGGPALADLDGDGTPEVVVGRQALNADGTLRWTGTAAAGAALSAVADLDRDGRPEVVNGNVAYRYDGSVLWQQNAVFSPGFAVVGNLDADPFLEVVGSYGGYIWVLEHNGAVKWGPTVIGNALTGPATLADLDGDGLLEIAVANVNNYVILTRYGQVLRTITRVETGVHGIGADAASAIDLDGDGAAELIYSDRDALKILRGSDGFVLHSAGLGSCDGWLYPVPADVDGDGQAEIVVPVTRHCGAAGPAAGVYVLGNAQNRWVTTRAVWNQHTYHVTNVEDDGRIPRQDYTSFPAASGFRMNPVLSVPVPGAPDLTASYVRKSASAGQISVTARIGNAGVTSVPAGVVVAFYDGAPGGLLLGTAATTTALAPGGYADVTLTVSDSTSTTAPTLWVSADDSGVGTGLIAECDETNNATDAGFGLNERPLVDAGPDQIITLPPGTLTLSGSATDDGLPASGGGLSYEWSVLSGPGSATFGDANSPTTSVSVSSDGVFVFRLTASDGAASGHDEVSVVVALSNSAPVVDAGPDQSTALPGATVALAGSVSDDGLPNGGSVSVTWSKQSGPGIVTFGDPSALGTSASFDTPGTYVLALTASDTELSATDTLTVTVTVSTPNQPPVVEMGPDQVVSLPNAVATLSPTVTDDGLPEGGGLSFQWSVASGPAPVTFGSPQAAQTTATFSQAGDYQLMLVVSDSQYAVGRGVYVTVTPPNQAPVVNAGADQTITRPPQTSVSLLGSGSDDGLPYGAPVTVEWTQVSGPPGVVFSNPGSLGTIATFPTHGSYVLRLTASDTQLQGADDVTVTVLQGNTPPEVSAGADQSITFPTNSVSLTGVVTDDGLPAGSSVTVSWSLASGPLAVSFANPASAATTATFDTAGTYVLRLTATDGALSASDDVVVQVQTGPPVGAPPVVTITSHGEGAAVTEPVEIQGSITCDSLLNWKLQVRKAGDAAFTTLASNTTPVNGTITTFDPTLLLNGQYEVVFRATDTAGRSSATAFTAVVKENLKVGNFTVSFTDLEVPVAGLPIRVTRTYDSRERNAVGDFGHGWRVDVSNAKLQENGVAGLSWSGTKSAGFLPTYCLVPNKPQVVSVTTPDGRVHEFEPVLTPSCQSGGPIQVTSLSFRPRPGTTTLGTLSVVGNNSVIPAGTWPGPMQLFDEVDYTIFDPETYLFTLPDGRQLTIHQEQGLKSIRDLNGNVLNVNSNGIVHSSGKGITFTRDAQGRISKVTDPDGHFLLYGYDGGGDLVSVTDREEHATTLTYYSTPAHLLNEIKDPLGRTPIRNEYDASGRLIKHTDAFGKTIEYTHSIGTRQEIVKDRNDKIRVLEYDSRGNVVKETQPDGRQVLRTFDARNNRASETEPHEPSNPDPPKTTYVYDTSDNLLSTTDAENNTTEYTYNARQQVLTTKDPKGKFTVNAYDATGNLLSTKSGGATLSGPFQSETTYTYDASGNVKTQTTIVDGVTQTTGYDYDAFGNLTRETDALGHATNYTYDARGNRLTQSTTRSVYTCSFAPGTGVNCTPSGTETLTTTYEYDRQGRLVKTTDPDNTFTRTVYDALGRQKESYDKLDRKTEFFYDEMGRLTKTLYADTTFEESTYDNEGRRLTSRDRGGRVTQYTYDDLGRLKKTIFADTTFTENFYDAAGRLEATKDARGKTTTYEYDDAGRRTKVKDPLLNETAFTYDGNGNQQTVRDARLNTTTFEYDALNRRTKTLFPDNTYTETTYDELGRRKSERDQDGKVTQFRYDALGRLVKVIDALNQETTYGYDELGNRIRQTDARGNSTWFQYDKLGRETKRILPDGSTESKTYDAAGNLETRTDFMGRTTTYGYDTNYRLTSRTYPNPSENVGFTYTATGRRLTATDSRGTTEYGYDNRDRLTSLLQPGTGSLSYSYDGNGNRTSLTATIGADSHTTTYEYDDASRLDIVRDRLNRAYDHGYDANGNRTSLAYPNGTSTSYDYNTLNRLTNLTVTGPSGTLFSQAFTLGNAGNRTKIVENDGTVKDYSYDALYRLTQDKVTTISGLLYQKDFTYDAVGNRETQTTAGSGAPGTPLAPGTINYGYDSRDRLLTENANNLTYDTNGNLTAKVGEATYTWDHETRLIRITKADGTVVTHAYDADGNRVKTEVTPPTGPPATTNFLVDTSGSLSHVVAELDAVGTLTTLYVRGDDLLSLMRPTGPGTWSSRFYAADGIGSIRKLTDEAGSITDSYLYTAFGEVSNHAGSDLQPYAFAGEPVDPNSGFQYHRARWIDPRAGRFTAMDAFSGQLHAPLSLHKYLYAHADPTDKRDPSGEFVDTLGGLNVLGILRSAEVSRVVASIAVLTFVAALVVGVAVTDDNVNPQVNRMRVQLQDETTRYGGASTHTHGVTRANRSSVGVTARQMRDAMDQLYRTYRKDAPWYPKGLDTELVWAIITTSERITGIVASGGVVQTGTLRPNLTWFGPDGVEYRLDLENLRGHNLRQ
jgi:RHS repeat-associated protein